MELRIREGGILKILKTIAHIVIVVVSLVLLVFCDLNALFDSLKWLDVFKKNMYWIESLIDTFTPMAVLVIVVGFAVWAKMKLSFTVTGCSVGGVEISLKNVEEEAKCNIRNYLNTKRSLFVTEPEYDNFADVFTSYHAVYEYLRKQLLLFDGHKKIACSTYKEIQNMLKELNFFLTKYQSDYHRWYEKKCEDDFMPLATLQKEYPQYPDLVAGFEKINKIMQNAAKTFEIDTFSWEDRIGSKETK